MQTINTGSLAWATANALGYYYMVSFQAALSSHSVIDYARLLGTELLASRVLHPYPPSRVLRLQSMYLNPKNCLKPSCHVSSADIKSPNQSISFHVWIKALPGDASC